VNSDTIQNIGNMTQFLSQQSAEVAQTWNSNAAILSTITQNQVAQNSKTDEMMQQINQTISKLNEGTERISQIIDNFANLSKTVSTDFTSLQKPLQEMVNREDMLIQKIAEFMLAFNPDTGSFALIHQYLGDVKVYIDVLNQKLDAFINTGNIIQNNTQAVVDEVHLLQSFTKTILENVDNDLTSLQTALSQFRIYIETIMQGVSTNELKANITIFDKKTFESLKNSVDASVLAMNQLQLSMYLASQMRNRFKQILPKWFKKKEI
jgi:ABC-type transporter Mla subunit MlaD